jgi:hypothetical protein
MLAGHYDEASSWAEKAMWAQNYLTPYASLSQATRLPCGLRKQKKP